MRALQSRLYSIPSHHNRLEMRAVKKNKELTETRLGNSDETKCSAVCSITFNAINGKSSFAVENNVAVIYLVVLIVSRFHFLEMKNENSHSFPSQKRSTDQKVERLIS
jgi:hypothetical protein